MQTNAYKVNQENERSCYETKSRIKGYFISYKPTKGVSDIRLNLEKPRFMVLFNPNLVMD